MLRTRLAKVKKEVGVFVVLSVTHQGGAVDGP